MVAIGFMQSSFYGEKARPARMAIWIPAGGTPSLQDVVSGGAMDAALFQEPRRRMIPLKDGEMAALDFGDASRPVDVVFLHANGFNAMTYRSILAPLSLSLRIVALDQRGHGLS